MNGISHRPINLTDQKIQLFICLMLSSQIHDLIKIKSNFMGFSFLVLKR